MIDKLPDVNVTGAHDVITKFRVALSLLQWRFPPHPSGKICKLMFVVRRPLSRFTWTKPAVMTFRSLRNRSARISQGVHQTCSKAEPKLTHGGDGGGGGRACKPLTPSIAVSVAGSSFAKDETWPFANKVLQKL